MWTISPSQVEHYLHVVRAALVDDKVFNSLKSIPEFWTVTGISHNDHCVDCAVNIKQNKEVQKNLEKFILNDTLCSPMFSLCRHNEKKIGQDTLRFVDSVARIQETIGSLEGKVVFEYGANLGSLAYMLRTQWPNIQEYYIQDFPDVMKLCKKYLSHLMDIDKINEGKFERIDLLISEYCLTEQDDQGIQDILNHYVNRANAIFIRCNISKHERYDDLIKKLGKHFDLEIEDEQPKSRHPNKVITGRR